MPIDGHGVVDVSAVRDPDRLAHAVLAKLGVRGPASKAGTILPEYLANRRPLLVFDGCDHILDAIADLAAAILAHADECRLVLTSRRRPTSTAHGS